MSGHKVVALNSFWASVLSLVLGTSVLGGITYAWNEAAALEVLKSQMQPLQQANIPQTLATLLAQNNNNQGTIQELKASQAEMNHKLDYIIIHTTSKDQIPTVR